jgi:DNA repair exonuclease SbcCD ATPase subunit
MLRVHRLALTNFKGVAAREVEFSEYGITLVCGPNEIGKSSLVDALDLLLDMRASSKHSRVVAARPTGRDVGPCVEAELTLGPHRLVYRKRWLRAPLTELRVLSPNPAQYSGDQAHERFNNLLAENGVDKDLWRKLRVDQGMPLGQASVGGYASVPAMAGEAEQLASVQRGPEEELFERAKAEYERYFTEKRNQPTGEFKAAREALEEAQAQAEEARAALAAAEGDLTEFQRTWRQLNEGATELTDATERLRELERRQSEAVDAEARLRALDAVLTEAEAIARQEGEVARLGDRLADNETEAEDEQRELVAAQAEAAQLEERVRECGTQRDAAKVAARLAADEVAWRRDEAEAEQLAAVLDRVEAAQRRLDEAEARLTVCKVTDQVLAEIDAAHRAWEKAHDQLTANAATVAVTRLGEAPVLLDGGEMAGGGPDGAGGAAGGGVAGGSERSASAPVSVSVPVLEARTVEVPGAVRVVVQPGSGEQARRSRERETAEAYRELCLRAGVADIAQAREAEQAWRSAREERQNAATAIEAALYDESADQLRSRLGILRTRIAAYLAGRSPEHTAAESLAAAQEAELAARSAVEVAEDRWRQAQDAVKRHETRVSTLRVEQAAAARAVRDAANELELARKRLGELGTPRTEAELARVRADRDATAERLARLDPEHLTEQLNNQRRLVPDLERVQNERRLRLEVLGDRLMRHGQSAPEEQLALAEAERERAQRAYDALERRARAAELLFSTLSSHREAARDRHTTPFRQRVERYAQRLFSQDVHVEIGPDLTIVSKTVAGVTVPFDSLSAGAREQLSLLARIACADLVGSVPLILDDVLGHSDRDRLADVAVILGQVADRAQIILLSHEPSRFPIAGINRVELGGVGDGQGRVTAAGKVVDRVAS